MKMLFVREVNRMKKPYSAPELKNLTVKTEDQFTAVCGPAKEFGNVGDTVNKCTITHGGPEYIPNNS